MFQLETEQQAQNNNKQQIATIERAIGDVVRSVNRISIPGEVDVKNLDEIKAHLHNELAAVIKAVKAIQFPDTVKVSNFPKISIPDSIKVSNFDGVERQLDDIKVLLDRIEFNPTVNFAAPEVTIPEIRIPEINVPQPMVNVEPANVTIDIGMLLRALLPLQKITNDPTKPIAVRLSDGRRFLEALKSVVDKQERVIQAFSTSNGGMTVDEYKTTIGGLNIPQHDKVEIGYTGSDISSVVYKRNSNTVATLALDYTGSNLTSVTKT